MPARHTEVDVLLRLFPDAQIIHVVRDARDNVASLKRMPWWKGHRFSAMARSGLAEYRPGETNDDFRLTCSRSFTTMC